MKKTILITGASSGFGKLSAKKFQQEGWNVIATMRSPEKESELHALENTLVLELDVCKKDSIKKAIESGIEHFGSIDVLVNNAGFGNFGIFEADSEELMRNIFEVNVFGLMNTTKAILPHFRKQKSGQIINISSIVGRVGFPLQALYHSTKFAVEGFSESIRHELEAVGVKINLIEPGGYNTKFLENIARSDASDFPEYNEVVGKYFDAIKTLLENIGDPSEVAEKIYEVASSKNPSFRNHVGVDSEQLSEARKNLSDADMYKTMKEFFKL